MVRDSITPVRLRKGMAEIQLGMLSYLFLFSVHAHLRACMRECVLCGGMGGKGHGLRKWSSN